MSLIVRRSSGWPTGVTPAVASATLAAALKARSGKGTSTVVEMTDNWSTKHLESAHDRVGSEPPRLDDVLGTPWGKPLDSADEVRALLASQDRVRTA